MPLAPHVPQRGEGLTGRGAGEGFGEGHSTKGQSMTYTLIVAPSAEALTLAEAKAHLRLDGSEEDGLLTALIRTAREHLERSLDLCLITQGWRHYLDSIPEDGVIQLAKSPIQAIESVTVYDGAGTPRLLSLDGHVLDGASRPARLFLREREAAGRAINGIEIDLRAGFGATGAEVPDVLKRAMLMHVAQMFELRGALTPDVQPAADVPAGYERLVASFRMRRL